MKPVVDYGVMSGTDPVGLITAIVPRREMI